MIFSGSNLKLLIRAFSFAVVIVLPQSTVFATVDASSSMDQSILENMRSTPNFSVMTLLVETARQEILFQDESKKRMAFVPIDNAFLDVSIDLVIHFLTDRRWNLHLIHFLRYHVIHEIVDIAADSELSVETLVDETVTLESSLDGGIIVNSVAEFVDEHILASNGAIQGIDNVLLPLWQDSDIAGLLELDPVRFSILFTLGKRNAEFMGSIRSSSWEPYTIFAPTNEAFSDSNFFELVNIRDFPNFLWYHLVPGIYTGADLMHATDLKSSKGQSLKVDVDPVQRTLRVNGNLVIQSNILANNGILHVLDGPLIPPLNENRQSPTHHPMDVETPLHKPDRNVDLTEPRYRCTSAWIEWMKNGTGYDEARACSQLRRREKSLSLDCEEPDPHKCSLNPVLDSSVALRENEDEYNKCFLSKETEESRGNFGIKCCCQQQEIGDGKTLYELECRGESNITCSPKYAECDSNERCCSNPLRRCVGGQCRDAIRPSRNRIQEAESGLGRSLASRIQN